MATLVNTDSFGNTYFNYFDALTDGEASTSDSQLTTFLQTVFGSSKASFDGSNFRITPPHGSEVLGTIASNKYRYLFNRNGTNFSVVSISTDGTVSGANIIDAPSSISASPSTPPFTYAIANQYSLCLAQFNAAKSSCVVSYFGTLKDAAYSGGNYARNYSGFRTMSTGGVYAYHPSNIDTGVRTDYATSGSVANYSITCTNSVSSPTTTDLVLRDDGSPNYAIGSCHNILKTSASVTLGSLYDIPNTVDGNTEQDRWLCVGNWGSEKLLMRVWTEGF